MEDKELVKDAQKDIKHFENIYTRYFSRIKNYFRPKVSNDEADADDLTSQTFEKALRNINGFKWQGASFSSWLYKIANNTLIDFYRKNKNSVKIDEDIYHTIRDDSKLVEDIALEVEFESSLKQILNKLPERERRIVELKFYDGLNNKEIANNLGLSETNISTILYRTIKKLKDQIKKPS